MKKNYLLNSFLVVIISFFLLTLGVKAADEYQIGTNETITLENVGSITEKSPWLIVSCSGTTCSVKMENTGAGLWQSVGHVIYTEPGGSVPKTAFFRVKNYYPVIVSLGDYHEFNVNTSQWGGFTLSGGGYSGDGETYFSHNTNSKAYESKTREKVDLPTPIGNKSTQAKNGLPIKFVNYVSVNYADEATGSGYTFIPTLPVMPAGTCEKGGVDGDGTEGVYNVVTDTRVDGTGPYVYMTCYEYENFVRISLGGGSWKDGTVPDGWRYDKQTNSYISQTSGINLPTDNVVFAYGLASTKKIAGWINQRGFVYTGGSLDLNGDVWTPYFEYDTDANSITDKDVRINDYIYISSSASEVESCSAESTKYLTAATETVGEGDSAAVRCKVTGVLYEEGNVTVVTVKYKNGEELKYNVTVKPNEMADSGEHVYDPEIATVGIVEKEDPGQGDIKQKVCNNDNAKYSTSTHIAYGSAGKIPGTDMNMSVYTATGCGMSNQIGLCIDPSAPGPNGSTYIRDESWDDMMNKQEFIKLIEAISFDVNSCTPGVNGEWGQRKGRCANLRSAAQMTFRLISVEMGRAWRVGGHDYDYFNEAAKVLDLNNVNTVDGALNKIFNSSLDADGKAIRDKVKVYLNTFINNKGTIPQDTQKYSITKKSEYKKDPNKDYGYYLYYSGVITTPESVHIDTERKYTKDNMDKFGYQVEITELNYKGPGKYEYKAKVYIPDARPDHLLHVPSSKEDKEKASVELKLTNSNISDIFVIKPASGAHLQRLLFYQEAERKVLIYFGPDYLTVSDCKKEHPDDPEACETFCDSFEPTKLEDCESELQSWDPDIDPTTNRPVNDPSKKCNVELYSVCCSLVDEGSYPNSFHKVCTHNCSYNTLGSVCSFIPYDDVANHKNAVEVYHIREGYQISVVDNKAKYNMNLGQCSVDLRNYAAASDTEKKQFIKQDGAGNILTLEQYEDNPYCQVTCREEWDMTLGAFGSFMGAESVRAGGSFAINKTDLFIRGDKYCYTSYLDHSSESKYVKDMNSSSATIKSNFDVYSKAAHEYSDLVQNAGTGTNVGASDKFGASGNVTKIGPEGGTAVAGLSASQGCKKWTTVTYYKRTGSTKDYCGDYGDGSSASGGKCYTTDWKDLLDNGSCPSGYDYSSSEGKCYHTDEDGEAKYTYSYDSEKLTVKECTEHSERYQGCGSSDCHKSESAPSGYGKTDYFKDQAVDISFYGSFKLTGSYNDEGSCGAGQYNKSDGSCSSYDTHGSSVTCTLTRKIADGGPDKVTCKYAGTTLVDKANVADDLVKKINKKTIGGEDLTSGMTMSGAGGGTAVNKYYENLKKELEDKMNDASSKISDAASKMNDNAAYWYDCNNFILYTSNYFGTDVSKAELEKLDDSTTMSEFYSSYGLNSNFKALGANKKPVLISTQFNPVVSYSYDEADYMDLLTNESKYGHDKKAGNVLEMNNKMNSAKLLGKEEYKLTADEEKAFFDENNPKKNLGSSTELHLDLINEKVPGDETGAEESPDATNQLNYSYKTRGFYSSNQIWKSGTKAYREYGDGAGAQSATLGSWDTTLCKIGRIDHAQGDSKPYSAMDGSTMGWNTGDCYSVKLYYYDNVNYIKRSVSNSSFYKNKGNWYSMGNAFTVHGDDVAGKGQGIDVYNRVRGTSLDITSAAKWTKLAYKNAFPISVTTPRNLYKYSYVFGNIGSYSDGKSYGRLMGNANSVFLNNTRTCFYEVVEQICKCCGDPSTSHVVDIVGTENDKGSTKGLTDNFIKNNKDDLGKIQSSDDAINSSNQASVGFYNTVASLTNLSAVSDDSGDRKLAANWGEEAIFNFNGYNRYVTNKGDVALKAIEAVGEDVYSPSHSAEYAYRLTPDAISDIKKDNESNNYGVSFDDDHMKAYGKAKMISTGSSDDVATTKSKMEEFAQDITFQHYGSVFLETVANKYAKGKSDDGTFNNLNLAKKSKVCTLDEKSEVGSSVNGKSVASAISKKMENEDCRWVDYIENDGSADKHYMDSYYGGKSDCASITDAALRKSCEADDGVQSSFRLAFK